MLLVKKISYERLAIKILKTLPKRFDMKGITIEEAQDISTIKVYEMIGLLLTFVMTINEKLEKRNKSVAFKADVKDDHD